MNNFLTVLFSSFISFPSLLNLKYMQSISPFSFNFIFRIPSPLKSISKGEISRAACLLEENKTTFSQNKLDYPEFFDIRIHKIKKDLLDIEQQYFSKSLNILQLGTFGSHLTNCKQRFIDTGIIMKNKRLSSMEIK